MAEDYWSTISVPKSGRPFDLDISAVLLAERLIGEIFGWGLVDWAAVEPYRGRRFFFGRHRHADRSIYDRLKPLYDRCDPERDEFSALKPSPVVNSSLTSLVGNLCRHVGRQNLPMDDVEAPSLERTAEQDHLHLAVIDHLIRRIDDDLLLSEQAGRLKSMACAAESELEKHFCDLINARLEDNFLPGGIPDRYKTDRLREQARERVEEMQALNERELVGLAWPTLKRDEDALVRIEMARILLSRFPYVRNYELMLLAELAMLQKRLPPRFARERVLSTKGDVIDRALIKRWDAAVARMSPLVDRAGRHGLSGSFAGRTFAVCGSGALPMTAFFLHLFTDAAIVLIDDDAAAVLRSKRLITNLERLGILEPGALIVHQRDAGALNFRAADQPVDASSADLVACDAVMIASLVDADAKMSIARQIEREQAATPFLIIRSATGLSAKLAYDPVPTETLGQGRLAFCGETLPATQVATHLDRIEAVRRRVACTASQGVLAIAHPDVVNTTEVYRKLPGFDQGFDLDFGAFETIEQWIRKLEAIGARYRQA